MKTAKRFLAPFLLAAPLASVVPAQTPAAVQSETAESLPVQKSQVLEGRSLEIVCSGTGVCRETLTGLPFRVLPRSFSNVYRGREASKDAIAVENVRAFYPLFVFARRDLDLSDPAQPKGWYLVGESVDALPLGWMQAQDVLEWKQALIVSYTHPGAGDEERRRVLMFKDLEALRGLVDSPERVEEATTLYRRIEKRDVPAEVISKEPERFVDINRKFFLLPIVDFETVDIEGDEARCLQVAAAVPGKRDADTLQDRRYREEALKKPQTEDVAAKALGVDVVFVADMTVSMQPYIDGTKKAMAQIARRITEERVKEKIRFGLVGYRDDVSVTPGLEFASKNFTPELVDIETFVEILQTDAKAARVSSRGYSEEVFAGVETALASRWNEDALRFMVIIGDASSHPVGHEQNTTGKDAFVLHRAAEDAQVHVLAIHLQDPKHPDDWALAIPQYSTLSRIRGKEGQSALVEVGTEDPQSLQAAVTRIAEHVADFIAAAQTERLTSVGDPPEAELTAPQRATPEPPSPSESVQQADQAIKAITEAALVEYLGREADPPKDIIVWALDRDLTDPAVRAMEVRVLVSKAQLSDLITALGQVIEAMQRAEMTQIQFFDALQGVAGQTLKNPEAINLAGELADSGLLPAFIKSLPYKSEILSLSDEMYASMTAEQRSALERSLRAKSEQYRDINEQVDGWVRLNDTDPESRKVYPLHLDYLP